MACEPCKHVFTDGYFDDEALGVIFGQDVNYQIVGQNWENFRPVTARMVSRISRFVQEGRWLDVGFGNASLIFSAKEFGFDPVGLDLRRQNVEGLRKMGFEAHCVDLSAFDYPHAFDVISFADVMEHMPYPQQALDAARRLLRRNGAVLVSMPNYGSPAWNLLGGDTHPYWGELEHYHNFSRERLYALLRKSGFRPVEYGVSERYRACMEIITLMD